MNYYLELGINLSCALLPVAGGIIRFRSLDKASRIFLFLLGFSFVTECAAFWAAKIYHNNLPVYNIGNIIQQFLIALYFNYCIDFFRRRNTGWLIGMASILLGVLNLIFLEPVNSYNSNFFLYQTIAIFIMGVIYFRQLLLPVYFKVQFNPHFWLIVILTSFYVLSFFVFSLYDYFSSRWKHQKGTVDEIILGLSVLSNAGYALVFFLYQKMQDRNG